MKRVQVPAREEIDMSRDTAPAPQPEETPFVDRGPPVPYRKSEGLIMLGVLGVALVVSIGAVFWFVL